MFVFFFFFFFFNDTATTEIYTSVNTLSLHDALPIWIVRITLARRGVSISAAASMAWQNARSEEHTSELQSLTDISYAVFGLKKKKKGKMNKDLAVVIETEQSWILTEDF